MTTDPKATTGSRSGRVPLAEAFATPEVKRRYTRWLFSTIAPRYDLITRVLSYGLDQRWKDRVAVLAAAKPGQRAIDLACGTGDLASRLARCGADVVGIDLAAPMIERARLRPEASGTDFVVGDMTHLPLGDACADVVTVGYGLRNVPDLDAALREIVRVLRPGGRLVALDFNRPANPIVRAAYFAYLDLVGSVLGLLLHRDADTYRYIPASLRCYPGAGAVAARMRELGFVNVQWRPLLGGLMAMHAGDTRQATDGGEGATGVGRVGDQPAASSAARRAGRPFNHRRPTA